MNNGHKFVLGSLLLVLLISSAFGMHRYSNGWSGIDALGAFFLCTFVGCAGPVMMALIIVVSNHHRDRCRY
jgi:hypothetical protein